MDRAKWSEATKDLERRTSAKVWSDETKAEMEAFQERLRTDDDFYERHYGVPRTKEKTMAESDRPSFDPSAAGTARRPLDAADQPRGRMERIVSHINQAGMMAENLGDRLGAIRARLLGDTPPSEVERAAKRPEEVLPGLDDADRHLEILEARMQTILGHLNALENL